MSDLARNVSREGHPPLLAVDAGGYVWRVYEGAWSMAPSNPDNSPIPQPVTYYAPVEGLTGPELEVLIRLLFAANRRDLDPLQRKLESALARRQARASDYTERLMAALSEHVHEWGPWQNDVAGVVRECACGAIDHRPEG